VGLVGRFQSSRLDLFLHARTTPRDHATLGVKHVHAEVARPACGTRKTSFPTRVINRRR
jgi:hypothetical protein